MISIESSASQFDNLTDETANVQKLSDIILAGLSAANQAKDPNDIKVLISLAKINMATIKVSTTISNSLVDAMTEKAQTMEAANYKTEYNDAYAHARAMTEQAQKGVGSRVLSQILGLWKEVFEDIPKNLAKGRLFSQALAESTKDLNINWDGFIMGRRNPNVPADESEWLNGKKVKGMK
ncbi:MAG: hypothetical protein LBB08_02930 [Rickettsiales bacterium]|nr:hypothetical protein [Rickettsiales bacterium]